MMRLLRLTSLVALLAAFAGPALSAQGPGDEPTPAFSLSSSEVFTTRDQPYFHLTHRLLPSLDFRVYKVRDPFAFFAGLRDPHQLGSTEPMVPTERSWIERLADWKREQRGRIRSFFRDQVSHEYRVERRRERDEDEVQQRVTLQVSTFAQVPLLNPDQLVTSWRELLPNYRDAELRRIPLDVHEPGVYVVEAVHDLLRAYTVVIVSDVGVVTKVSPGQLVLFAADRFSGEPRAGCDVQVLASQQQVAGGQTSTNGLLEVALPAGPVEDVIGVALCDGQVAATDPGAWYLGDSPRQLLAYTYTDKPIYRPGHTVHAKVVLRWRERDAVVPFDRDEVELSASDVNDKVVFRQRLPVSRFGTVEASFEVPATAALGYYTLRITTGDETATGAFEVQEYRKPEFEVRVTPSARFIVQGNELVASIEARYYFGQPVANGRVHWVVNQQPYYSPLRWDDGFDGSESSYWYGGDQRLQGDVRLDERGRAEIRIPLAADENGRDYSARLEAQVTDAGGREVSGDTVVHATYGPFMLAARTDNYVFRAGSQVRAFVRAIDYQGQAQSGVPVTLTLDRITYPDGYYSDPVATRTGETTAATGEDGLAEGRLTLGADAGTYRITVATSVNGRRLTDEAWVWVPGAESTDAFNGDRYLELLADKRSYAPGDVARLMVRGESVTGPVLVTKEGQHVSWYQLLRPAASDAIEVPIEPGDAGDVYVNLTYMRDGRLFRAERRLSVPADSHRLTVALTAEQEVSRPQEPGVFSLQVTDAEGQPVQAEVSLAVIDEAVFGVKADDTPDPVRFFYRREYSRVGTVFSREYYFTGFSGSEQLQLAQRRRRPFTLADFKGEPQAQPAVRKDFPDAIYWIGDLTTDAEGRARVSVRYPDALTTWRLTARAVTPDTRVGIGVARTTTTKDLIVRVLTPRFLTEGDEVVLPTLVHNYREGERQATVSLSVDGLSPVGTAPAPTLGTLAAGAERRDNWTFRADTPGTASVTASASTATDTDAVELPVPVLPYGLHRETAASGSVQSNEATTTLAIPATANPSGRRIRVELAPSLAGSMLGALDYLTSFPYGCTEQTLSSFLPNVLVTRTLTRLNLTPTERLGALDRQVSQGLARLYDYQHDNGGWGWWKTDENHPFMTAYAIYGLLEARDAGYRVEEWRIDSGARALARMYADYPRAVPDLKAYMAYVLGRASDQPEITWYQDGESHSYRHDAARDELWAARDRLSAQGQALLLLALPSGDERAAALAGMLAEAARTEGQLAWWPMDNDPLLFDFADTTVEATSFAVQALARVDPQHRLLEPAVRWLLLNRRGGYWGSTKQTAMALYGLLDYMDARGDTARPAAAEIFVNGERVAERRFTAADLTAPEPVVLSVPAREGANDVRVVETGGGTVYWSAAAEYYDPTGAEARSGSRQLAVTRRYARLQPVTVDGRIVYREQAIDGPVQAGDILTVRLTVAGAPDWRYLVLEDPLPAGVEAVQDTTAYPLERPADWWWGSRVEYRDEKTVFFQEGFEQGRYEFVYLARVIAEGVFRAVPAQIAPMYVPGVTASSEPGTLRVSITPGGAQ
ncbi:MAG: alpha-2-macroglobulin [Vicinamibacterales bacterium]